MKRAKEHPKIVQQVANMAPASTQDEAMLGSRTVLEPSKSDEKTTPKETPKKKPKKTPKRAQKNPPASGPAQPGCPLLLDLLSFNKRYRFPNTTSSTARRFPSSASPPQSENPTAFPPRNPSPFPKGKLLSEKHSYTKRPAPQGASRHPPTLR